jgi:hypothetical protein
MFRIIEERFLKGWDSCDGYRRKEKRIIMFRESEIELMIWGVKNIESFGK